MKSFDYKWATGRNDWWLVHANNERPKVLVCGIIFYMGLVEWYDWSQEMLMFLSIPGNTCILHALIVKLYCEW